MDMEVYWAIDSFARSGVWNGFGVHGDIFAGWETDTLQALTDECKTCDGDNQVDACLDASEINTNDEMNACTVPSPVDEPIWGWLDNQPGCNKPQPGPEEAVQATCEEPGLSAPTTQHTDVLGWTYEGCYMDYVDFKRLLTSDTSASLPHPVIPSWCGGFCNGTGTADDAQRAQKTKYKWMMVEYSYQCFCGNDILPPVKTPSNNVVTGLVQRICNSVCTADQTQLCGGSNGGYSPVCLYSLDGGDTSSSTKEKRASDLHATPMLTTAFSRGYTPRSTTYIDLYMMTVLHMFHFSKALTRHTVRLRISVGDHRVSNDLKQLHFGICEGNDLGYGGKNELGSIKRFEI